MSATVSVEMYKNGALSWNPMGSERWKPNTCGSSGRFMDTSNAIVGVSSRRTHSQMQVYDKSTLLRKTTPKGRSGVKIQLEM